MLCGADLKDMTLFVYGRLIGNATAFSLLWQGHIWVLISDRSPSLNSQDVTSPAINYQISCCGHGSLIHGRA